MRLRAAVLVPAAVLAVAAAGGALVLASPAGGRTRPGPPREAARAAPQAPPAPPRTWIATLSQPTGYSATPGGAVSATLPATNPFGGPQTLAVLGAPGGQWVRVELPVRPNGSTGWIRAAGVKFTWTSYAVLVDVEHRTLTVKDAAATVLTVPAAVGAPATYTPEGDTYLWELVRPNDPSGPYGPYIFGLAEFSDSYNTFNGGEAQIAIHGNDEPWSIGQAASHGCVRLANAEITRLAAMLPLGTPVTIY